MNKIQVKIEKYYWACPGSEGTSKTLIKEVPDNVFAMLKEIDAVEISSKKIAGAIKKGQSALKELHLECCNDYYNMVEDYWLYDTYNEFYEESIKESLNDDIELQLFKPEYSKEEFKENWLIGSIDTTSVKFDYDFRYDDIVSSDDFDGLYETYLLNSYHEWLWKHEDKYFIAPRVGLYLDDIREEEANYVITLLYPE